MSSYIPQTPLDFQISPPKLTFKPGGEPVTFMVTVVNPSDRFASFRVSLKAAGADPQIKRDWYQLKPDLSSKTPPGGEAQFQVTISKNPVPGFVGLMNVEVCLFSVELPDSLNREYLHLTLEEGTEPIALNLKLPVQYYNDIPGGKIIIPVQIEQSGYRPVKVEVQIRGLETSWLIEGAIQRLSLPPKKQKDLKFVCQLPATEMARAQVYPFTIEADFSEGNPAQVQGKVEILPQGKIIVSCKPQSCQIRTQFSWPPTLKSEPAIYKLQFDNQSNLEPNVGASLYESEDFPSYWQIIPQDAPSLSVLAIKMFLLLSDRDYLIGLLFLREYPRIKVNLGQTGELSLKVNAKRHWLGRMKTLFFSVSTLVEEQSLEVENERQFLKLRVYPKIPLWLTGLVGLFLFWLTYNFSCLNPNSPICGHQKAVKSIQFNGRGLNAVSGADDQTIIEWNVEGFGWQHLLIPPTIGEYISIGNNQSPKLKPKAVQELEPKAVRVVRYRPVDNNAIAAGLENGEIQLWNLLGSRQCPQAVLNANRADRVLDLAFTSDAKFLYSSHGSGKILRWQVDDVWDQDQNCRSEIEPQKEKKFDFAIYSLILVDDDKKYLALAGQYNTLCLTKRNFTNGDKCELIGSRKGSVQDYIQSVDNAQGKPYLLASANNQGQITIWNLQDCLRNPQECKQLKPVVTWPEPVVTGPEKGEEASPLYSVALSDNGCYLVTGGESGEVKLWSLTGDGQLAPSEPIVVNRRGINWVINKINMVLNRPPKQINTVDIKVIDEEIQVLFGGDRTKVELETIETKDKKLPQVGCN